MTAHELAAPELAGYGCGDHPYLTDDGAQALAEAGAALVGVDSVNVDATTTGDRPARTRLLRAGIPMEPGPRDVSPAAAPAR